MAGVAGVSDGEVVTVRVGGEVGMAVDSTTVHADTTPASANTDTIRRIDPRDLHE